MDRGWSICQSQDGNIIAIGYDDGTLALKIGGDEPIASMKKGKLIWSKNLDIQLVNLKSLKADQLKDGEPIDIIPKDIGTSDIYPQLLQHGPNGHVFAINSDNEYQLYRSQTFKGTGFGSGMDFVWASTGNLAAVRDAFKIKIFQAAGNELLSIKPDYKLTGLFGGHLLCVKSKDFIVFYDWKTAQVIRRIDISPTKVIWDEEGTQVALVTKDGTFLLKFNPEQVTSTTENEEEGFEKSFDIIHQLQDPITSGHWIKNCFFFTTNKGKLNYTIGTKHFQVGQFDQQLYTPQSFFIPDFSIALFKDTQNLRIVCI